MEFVEHEEVMNLLREQGVTEVKEGDQCTVLRMADGDDTVHLHITTAECDAAPREGARVITVDTERLGSIVETLVHDLHLDQVLLFPVGKWRDVFDAVAFSMASNDDWQEIDAMATVALNGRDPLICEPGDYHTLGALVAALVSDADQPQQGLILTTTASPMIIELVTGGAVRISVGNPVLADEVAETLTA